MRRKPQSRDSTPGSPFGPVSYWPNSVPLGAWITIFYVRFIPRIPHLSTHPLCGSQSLPSTSSVHSATQRRNSGPHASDSSSSSCSSSLPSSSTAAAAPRAARTASTSVQSTGTTRRVFQRLQGVRTVFVTALFAFAGTELVGLAASETPSPRKTLLISLNLPHNDEFLLSADAGTAVASLLSVSLAHIPGLDHLIDGTICVCSPAVQ
jgi:amino acid transporter